MKTSFAQKQLTLAVLGALVLGFSASAVQAQQATNDPERANWMENGRATIWKNAYGECWQSVYGPASGYNECNPAPVAKAAAPAPVAYVPPAPVIIAAAPPQPVYEKYTLDANVLFDFDKSTLRPAGRDTLDQFVTKIHGLDTQSILAIGYADRMGSHASNQTLSEDRVNTVKAYLVGKGIAADRFDTSGRGETRPTTFPAECKDANNAKNVACMQPDRHVFIEVSGTRLVK